MSQLDVKAGVDSSTCGGAVQFRWGLGLWRHAMGQDRKAESREL